MKRKYKRRTSRFGIFFVFLTAVTIAGVFFIPWAMKPDNFRNEKNKINSWLNGIFFQDFYNAKSLILVDLSNDNIFISKRENEQQLPASLAKLFVIEYAATLADLDSIVPANYEASLLVAKEEDLIKNLNPKITGWKNYYSTKRNEKWMQALDWYIICTFTRWYNKKHQRRNRMSKVGFVRNSIYEKGLKKMARA